ncbi:MAG: DNA mismatch repair endonuclease MutL [Candidatus Kariarchaeaceae archaeon]|jgi:DNA mismatch repair protein MutL
MKSSKIEKLSAKIVGRIAAGEVVERPVNILKELIENSIDAETKHLLIRIENGGNDGIFIQDDGVGIPSDDLFRAFELHTTSKLTDQEISNVSTLGFRGEALASIAAISVVECKSRSKFEDEGREIKIVVGELERDRRISMKSGTSIAVSAIFHNVPARRKFLKKPSTERKRIEDLVMQFSISYPEIHFILEEKTNSRIKKRVESPPRQSILSVIYDILGYEIASGLLPVKGEINHWKISGFISKPLLIRSDRNLQYLCVNGRNVRHTELQNAIESAYGSQLMRSSHPILLLQFAGPTNAIDFNVHPQKSEIRFQTSDTLISKIGELIHESLKQASEIPTLPMSKIDRVTVSADREHSLDDLNVVEPFVMESQTSDSALNEQYTKSIYSQQTLDNTNLVSSGGRRVLGHVMHKFGIIESENNELWLVDIHAADERVKFEKYEKGTARSALSQQFLEPMVIELLISEKELLLSNLEKLSKFGLNISNGPEQTLLVHSSPVYYDQNITPGSLQKLLQEIAIFLGDSDVSRLSVESPFSRIEYGIAARLACHGSIRSGEAVSSVVISKVVDELLKCNHPWTCAHGRPTIMRLPKSRLDGWFNR